MVIIVVSPCTERGRCRKMIAEFTGQVNYRPGAVHPRVHPENSLFRRRFLCYPTGKEASNMAKIYYVGDSAVLTGPVFAETPFYHSPKGLDIFNYGKWLKEALESTGRHTVESVPSWDFYNNLGPGDYEK